MLQQVWRDLLLQSCGNVRGWWECFNKLKRLGAWGEKVSRFHCLHRQLLLTLPDSEPRQLKVQPTPSIPPACCNCSVMKTSKVAKSKQEMTADLFYKRDAMSRLSLLPSMASAEAVVVLDTCACSCRFDILSLGRAPTPNSFSVTVSSAATQQNSRKLENHLVICTELFQSYFFSHILNIYSVYTSPILASFVGSLFIMF